MGVGAGLYMCDVVKKSSRSLSHLLMSSCYLSGAGVLQVVLEKRPLNGCLSFWGSHVSMVTWYGAQWSAVDIVNLSFVADPLYLLSVSIYLFVCGLP